MLEEERDYRPTKMTLIIRVAVGFYLLYTAYSLIEGILSSSGNEQVFLAVAAVAFLIIGILLVYFSGKALMNGGYAGAPKPEAKEVRKVIFEEKKEEQEKPEQAEDTEQENGEVIEAGIEADQVGKPENIEPDGNEKGS